MGLTTEQYEKLIRFMDAEMELDEMAAFEKELAANSALRRQLHFEQSVRDSFALQNISSIPISKDVTASGGAGKVTSMRNWLAICAAVVTIFMLYVIFWGQQSKNADIVKSNNVDTANTKTLLSPVTVTPAKDSNFAPDLPRLFKQFFKADSLPEHYPLYLAEAFTHYEAGNYTTLQKLNLNNLPQTRGSDEENNKWNILKLGYYYKGLAFLQANNTEDAIINLNWVVNNQSDKALRAKAQWYLALTYLKTNKESEVAELCRNIINQNVNQQLVKNAGKLLAQLKP